MKIAQISLHNFRIYHGHNSISFSSKDKRNLSIIAGKNGYGKTTLLTSLVWAFYGRLMAQVEEKYRKDIKSAGGYENYLNDLFNHQAKINLGDDSNLEDNLCYVKIELTDVSIPSIPCERVTITRSYNIKSGEENLEVLIDGAENELTKEVGYEIFINDFILPREIAKFFFFDAEKIVSLAEARSKNELRNLSRAYSEVLGIKKYEELRKNLESLLSKLRRSGVDGLQKVQLDEFDAKIAEKTKLITYNQEQQDKVDQKVNELKSRNDSLQEKLIREGNSLSLEDLNELKLKRDNLKENSDYLKRKLKKHLDIAPLVISGKHLVRLDKQLKLEAKLKSNKLDPKILEKELKNFSEKFVTSLNSLDLDKEIQEKINQSLNETFRTSTMTESKAEPGNTEILLDFSEEKLRKFQTLLDYIQTSFQEDFNKIVQEEKTNKILLNRALKKIKQGEVRKNNHLAKKIREEKKDVENEIHELLVKKENLIAEFGAQTQEINSLKMKASEFEKNFKLQQTDEKKYKVTETLLVKINTIITRIKEEKRYSLQKAILMGLKRLMHKNNFIEKVGVSIREEVMDIDLISNTGNIINKDALSKGEQQLYATALLKALVDESGINFPVFIDSPLQKFDKFHAENIIQEFYPTISEQVVLFPLLEKELSEAEFKLITPHLNQAFLIQNSKQGSRIEPVAADQLFLEFKKETSAQAY
ncbi:DNA sulfur modification protein DndD [Salegentibacter sp. 24]|uniref:DNA sulfur modification protein DndD n=1 Tax=Salegentibacter sp. 24 TaxID=2183986 RepID=UPI00105EC7FB|nr:DNA sulfur modification protein DndD [Salegentibacter sp. 24]TDN87059.1 DNA sulfur modification protein DndD [Salegentibacter sp. 24]